jgi:hypothetical protein
VGVSDIPEIALNYTRADLVSNGEAENVLPPLLKALEERRPCEDLPGFVYRRGEDIIKQARAAAPNDLDALPYPAYHLFDVDYISTRSYNGRGSRSLHLMTSRGCPFKCNFCINSVLNDRALLEEIHGQVQEDASKSQRVRDAVPNSRMFHDFAKNITDWDWYFRTLSKIDFDRNLLVNLPKMPQKKLLAMRNWVVAETFSARLAPRLTGVLHKALTRLLIVALAISDRCPNSLRRVIRSAIRAIFGRTASKTDGDGGDRSTSAQVPPSEYGQSGLPDAYEESLKELVAQPRK